jgi:hypothetical protein
MKARLWKCRIRPATQSHDAPFLLPLFASSAMDLPVHYTNAPVYREAGATYNDRYYYHDQQTVQRTSYSPLEYQHSSPTIVYAQDGIGSSYTPYQQPIQYYVCRSRHLLIFFSDRIQYPDQGNYHAAKPIPHCDNGSTDAYVSTSSGLANGQYVEPEGGWIYNGSAQPRHGSTYLGASVHFDADYDAGSRDNYVQGHTADTQGNYITTPVNVCSTSFLLGHGH